jgi:hypothetical protein
MTDKSQKLDLLQDILIDEFIERIKSGEATPSDLNAARQMLKDNGIQCQISDANPVSDLLSLLPFEDSETSNAAQI